MTDKKIISNLLEEFRLFKVETSKVISCLRKKVKELEEELDKYKNPKKTVKTVVFHHHKTQIGKQEVCEKNQIKK